MHDFLLAKEIIDEALKIAREKNLADIKSVGLEIGSVALAHNNFPKHTEDININNLKFGLRSIAKNTVLENVEFNVKKSSGNSWKIVNIKAK